MNEFEDNNILMDDVNLLKYLPLNQACDDGTQILIGVRIHLMNARDRTTVRRTWGKFIDRKLSTKLIFLVGSDPPSTIRDRKVLMLRSVLYRLNLSFFEFVRNIPRTGAIW